MKPSLIPFIIAVVALAFGIPTLALAAFIVGVIRL